MMAACNDAAKVVITDYPEQVLIDMIDNNVKKNLSEETIRDRVYVKVSLFGTFFQAMSGVTNWMLGCDDRAISGVRIPRLCWLVWKVGGLT